MRSLRSLVDCAVAIGFLLSPASNATPVAPRGSEALAEIRQSSPSCSDGAIIKNLWLVEQLNVTYTSDERVKAGNASWTIKNTLANTTERILCSLRANYICELNGTPGDASLYIRLQINLDIATFTLNQSAPCGTGTPKSAYAIGTAQLYLVCPRLEQDLSCYGDDDGGGFANGSVTLPAPSP